MIDQPISVKPTPPESTTSPPVCPDPEVMAMEPPCFAAPVLAPTDREIPPATSEVAVPVDTVIDPEFPRTDVPVEMLILPLLSTEGGVDTVTDPLEPDALDPLLT